jgi:hypothetical protein
MPLSRFAAFFLALSLMAAAQNTPVPLVVQPLSPASVAPGSPSFTLTIHGTGFAPGAQVAWNGTFHATTFVSASEVQAAIDAADVATASTAAITVVNPAPGGGTSNVVYLPVGPPNNAFTLTGKIFPAGSQIRWIAAGDFNLDGKMDVVAANSSQITFLRGNGDGTLATSISTPSACNAQTIAVGDFNNDGKPDVVVADASQEICVMLGVGNGKFTHGATIFTGFFSEPYGLAVADFNGDGNLDIAVVDNFTKKVSILLGKGDGNFYPQVKYFDGVSGFLTYIVAGDFDNDGAIDLAVAGDRLSVLLGNGDGTFQSRILTGDSSYSDLVAGDFNGDGNLDLVAVEDSQSSLEVLLGNGTGHFPSGTHYPVLFSTGGAVVAGDFNNDGQLDVAWEGGSILFGKGDGTFSSPLTVAGSGGFLTTADFDNNGQLDFAFSGIPDITVMVQTSLDVSPASVMFPPTLFGQISQPIPVNLSNSGTSPISLSSVTIGGPNSNDFFTVTNTCGATIASGESCAITIAFLPSHVTNEIAELSITDDAPGSPQLVVLSGRGTPLTISPTQLRFGDVPVGQMSKERWATLTNVSNVPLRITGILVHGNDPDDFRQQNDCGTHLEPGASCKIGVVFSPLAMGERDASVYLGIGANSTNILLNGKGI